MNPMRQYEGDKRALRLVKITRATASPRMLKEHPELFSDRGFLFQMWRHTRKRCSGPCCGNPRRHFGQKTIQEIRADDEMVQQLDDIYSERW